MTRARLFQLRFTLSASVLLLAFVVVRLLWYPSGYFQIFGAGKLFLMLAAVVLVVGSGLSTLIFIPGKKGLKFDLIVLACIEIAVLGWGMYEIHERRPIYAVYAVDRFEAVSAAEVDLGQLQFPDLAARPGHEPRLVYAEMPTDVDELNQLIDETVFMGMADIDRRPEFWRPYPQGLAVLKASARPLATLLAGGDTNADVIQRWLDRRSASADDFLYLPIQGSRSDGTIILHADIGYPVDVLAIEIW